MPICSTILPRRRCSISESYLSGEDTRKVLRCYQRDIARFIHSQMQEHYWEEAVEL